MIENNKREEFIKVIKKKRNNIPQFFEKKIN